MPGFFSLPRGVSCPSVMCPPLPAVKVEQGVWGPMRHRDSIPESSVENHCLPYNKSITYLQCALRGLVRARRSVNLQTVIT